MTEYGEQLANMMRRLETAESALAALRRGVFGELPPGIGSVEDRLAAIERTQVGALAAMGDPVVVHSGASAVDANELPIVESAFPVTLAVTSGTSGLTGNATTKCGYEYDVEDAITGYKYFGAGTSPAVAAANPIDSPHKWIRPEIGYMIAATFGYAHRNSTGALVIGWINEVADQEACEVEEE